MFDDYISKKIMRYASGDTEDLNWVKQQMTMEAITQGTAEHVMHHVMINFMLNGEMRFMQFEFANKECFPTADEIHCVEYDQMDSILPKESNTCYVILTRGHKDDRLCLEKVLDRPHLYLGMIGSKGKVKKTFDTLIER